MKKSALVFLFILLAISCEKNNIACECRNPLEDLPWLKELKDSFTNCTCRTSIIQAEYNKQTVFYVVMNDELCDGWYPLDLKDCDGNTVWSYNGLSEEFYAKVKERKIIYSCKTDMYK